MSHQEKFYQRLEVAKMAKHRGLGLRKCGHLFQVFSDKLGTLYQSHDIMDMKEWLRSHNNFMTQDIKEHYVDEKPYAIKYGRVIQL